MPVMIALGLAAAAAWRGALGPGIVLFLASTAAWLVIRARFDTDPLPVATARRTGREQVLVGLVGVGMLYLPALAIGTPLLDFAGYRTPDWLLALGGLVAVAGIWLFWRSHADLGRNWSPALELRDAHALVTSGVYSSIRHPMYAAIFLIAGAQAAFLGNLVAGPAGLLAFAVLYFDRTGPEEAMMADRFGADWQVYAAHTGRLVPPGFLPKSGERRHDEGNS